MKEIRLLIHLLKAGLNGCDLTQDLEQDPILKELVYLYLQFHHINYYFLRQQKLNQATSDSTKAYEITFKQLRAKYSMKEYVQVVEEIANYVKEGNFFSLELVQLFLAALFCLGRFDITARMYAKYYELVQDPEALFFNGLSLQYSNQHEAAQSLFNQFIAQASATAAKRIKYQELIAQAQKSL